MRQAKFSGGSSDQRPAPPLNSRANQGLSLVGTMYVVVGFVIATSVLTGLLGLMPVLAHNTFLMAALLVLAFSCGATGVRLYDAFIEPLIMLRNLKKARQELGLEVDPLDRH